MIGLRTYEAAHACVVSNLGIFIAITTAFGVAGVLIGLSAQLRIWSDQRRRAKRLASDPLGIGASTELPGGMIFVAPPQRSL